MASAADNGSKTSFAPPRKISVQKFAEARGSELEALHSIVSNRLNGDFRSSRNDRRRTTAYDNQAAKSRPNKRRKLCLFGKTKSPMSENELKKVPRRVRRRIELQKNPEIGFVTSGDGTKRLRTHLWHTKRFTMTKRWGFYLPLGLQGRGRGSRAVLKWFRNGAVVHDASYFAAVQLEGPEDSLMSILKMVLLPSPSAQAENISNAILCGVVYGTAMLHQVGAPLSKLIAPVNYMWQPHNSQSRENEGNGHVSGGESYPESSESCSSHRQLWVWIHASAFSEGYDTLKFACEKQSNDSGILVKCYSLEGQVAKLELMGSKSFQLLQNTLHSVSWDPENSWRLKKNSVLHDDEDSLFKKCSVLQSEGTISSQSVLSLTVMDPRLLPVRRVAHVSVSAPAGVLSSMPEDLAKDYVPLPEEINSLLTSLSKHDGDSLYNDNRNIWDSCSRIYPPFKEDVLCLEKHHLRMNSVCLGVNKPERLTISSKGQGSISCPILLLKNENKAGSFMGWSIILPLSWVKVFWSHLVSKGGHAIGLREKRWISCEVGLPLFPLDFPESNAYSDFMETEGAAFNQKLEQLPPAVRPFKTPSTSPWNSICCTLCKRFTALREKQVSSENDTSGGNSLSNIKCGDCSIIQPNAIGNSFNGIVARTSNALTDFLNEIYGNHLLLFPQAPNRKTNFLKFMRDESKLDQAHNGINRSVRDHKLCFIRVLLHAYKEGFFEEGAVVCAPRLTDIWLWTSRSENIDGRLQIPESSVSSYFEEKLPGKWELHIPQDPEVSESHRWPIGFITTGFTRGSKKPGAVALCEVDLLAHVREEQWNGMPVKRRRKEIYLLVRNLRSTAYRLALATIILEKQVDDLEFL